jgi:hypothetical protein
MLRQEYTVNHKSLPQKNFFERFQDIKADVALLLVEVEKEFEADDLLIAALTEGDINVAVDPSSIDCVGERRVKIGYVLKYGIILTSCSKTPVMLLCPGCKTEIGEVTPQGLKIGASVLNGLINVTITCGKLLDSGSICGRRFKFKFRPGTLKQMASRDKCQGSH